MVQDPRGFLLPRFVNVGRHLMAANVVLRPTSKNLQDCGLSLRARCVNASSARADIHIAEELSFFLHRRKAAWSPKCQILRNK